MAQTTATRMPRWAWLCPLLAWGVLVGTFAAGAGGTLATAAQVPALVAVVFAVIYHAEIVALRVGEPLGTLVLALAVTVIEVALIVSIMLGGGAGASTLLRDTTFAAAMISLNGLVGLSLLLGGVLHHEQEIQAQGAGSALAVLAAMVTLTLVLPSYTTSAAGPVFTGAQLAFAGLVSLALYCVFVFVQTVRHRDYFLPDASGDEEVHAPPPSSGLALLSAVLLLASLVAVMGLVKILMPASNDGVAWLGAPTAITGIAIAMLVLMPEGLAALRAARANRLQTSMNLALGSALASIGLTIPAVAAVVTLFGQPLVLGLGAKEQALLALTLLVSLLTLGTGRTTVLQGALHLVILASFLFLAMVP